MIGTCHYNLSRLIECITLRMNPNVNYGFRVGNVDNGETMHVGGKDLCEIPSSQICCEPKSALKYSLLKIN